MDARAVVDTAALDRYRFIRNAYLQKRRYDVHDGKLPPEKEEDE
jgi:phospholipid-binding lipoprotein MlaA